MATGGYREQQLTNRQIVRLASAISANNMTAIAEGYMDISDETIKNKKYENKDDAEGVNREIIKIWRNKNQDNQIKVREFLVTCKISDIGEESGDPDQLTRKQIVRLAAAISANNMAAIAEGYMDISDETIKNKKYENKDDAQAFKREIIKVWVYKNSGDYVKVRHSTDNFMILLLTYFSLLALILLDLFFTLTGTVMTLLNSAISTEESDA